MKTPVTPNTFLAAQLVDGIKRYVTELEQLVGIYADMKTELEPPYLDREKVYADIWSPPKKKSPKRKGRR